MPIPGEALKDRKLQAVIGSAFLAVLLGFVAIPDDTGLRLVIYGGYWVILGTVVVFAWALWRSLRVAGPVLPATKAASFGSFSTSRGKGMGGSWVAKAWLGGRREYSAKKAAHATHGRLEVQTLGWIRERT